MHNERLERKFQVADFKRNQWTHQWRSVKKYFISLCQQKTFEKPWISTPVQRIESVKGVAASVPPCLSITCFAPSSILSLQLCSSVWSTKQQHQSYLGAWENGRFLGPNPHYWIWICIVTGFSGNSYALYSLEGSTLNTARMGFLEHNSMSIPCLKSFSYPHPIPCLQIYGFTWHKRPFLERLLPTFQWLSHSFLNATPLIVSLFTPGFIISHSDTPLPPSSSPG